MNTCTRCTKRLVKENPQDGKVILLSDENYFLFIQKSIKDLKDRVGYLKTRIFNSDFLPKLL